MKTSLIVCIICVAVAHAAEDPITIDPDQNGNSGGIPGQLEGTGLTTRFCGTKDKMCPGADTETAKFAPSADQCLSRCAHDVKALGAFYEANQICHCRKNRCTTAELVDSPGGVDLYRLKKGERCPADRPDYMDTLPRYGNSFCVMKGKTCKGNDMYQKPQKLSPVLECLKKCSRLVSCVGVDYSEMKCEIKGEQCKDEDLVDAPGTDNYLRLDAETTTCGPNREVPDATVVPQTTPAPTEPPTPDTKGVPEIDCFVKQYGVGYRGHVSKSESGLNCQRWDSQRPNRHSMKSRLDDFSTAENYCRNPDNYPGGPWCYTTSSKRWEVCGIPACVDCFSAQYGLGYRGDWGKTISGKICQRWDSQSPHAHSMESRLDDFSTVGNHCRNPDEYSGGPWCYTMSSPRWEVCGIPRCVTTNCRNTPMGKEYRGHVSKTKNGKTCQRWDSQTPHIHSMKSRLDDFSTAENYCRNPDNHPGGPWCYTTSSTRWEECDIPICTTTTCRNTIVGKEYRGNVSKTKYGLNCQRWDSQSPHAHSMESRLDDFSTAENYCRNPDNYGGGPWCYTTSSKRWEVCDIPICKDSK